MYIKVVRMKHLIIGTGTIGRATGELLESHNQDVTYNDVNADIMVELKDKQHKKINFNIRHDYDFYWVCTAEWNVEDVIKTIKDKSRNIIIRSTIQPHEIEYYRDKYPLPRIAHIPEFIRQKTAINDIFNTDHFIIGVRNAKLKTTLTAFFDSINIKHTTCTPQESSLIKLISNAWLAMQISFWNEIKKLSDHFDGVNPQLVANAVTLDHRISKYGSNMIGMPFGGFCLPKDTISLKQVFKEAKINQNMISALIKTNDEIRRKNEKTSRFSSNSNNPLTGTAPQKSH